MSCVYVPGAVLAAVDPKMMTRRMLLPTRSYQADKGTYRTDLMTVASMQGLSRTKTLSAHVKYFAQVLCQQVGEWVFELMLSKLKKGELLLD